MRFERISVSTRDDYRGSQEPTRIEWRHHSYDILEILDRWYEGYLDAGRVPMRYFKVKTTVGDVFILRHHELFQAWSMLIAEDDPDL